MPKKANAGAASVATRTSAASEERESVSVDLRCEREEWREVYLDEVINNEERVVRSAINICEARGAAMNKRRESSITSTSAKRIVG